MTSCTWSIRLCATRTTPALQYASAPWRNALCAAIRDALRIVSRLEAC